MRWTVPVPLLALLLALPACDGDDEPVGGPALAVEVCEQDMQCGDDRLCVCGRCTIPCGADEGCQLQPDAGAPAPLACYRMRSSLLEDRCTGLRPDTYRGVCLQTCSAEDGCEDDQQCRNGACVPQLNRSGQPATSGREPGLRAPGEEGSDAGVPTGDLGALAGSGCLSEPSRVTFLGDSYVAAPVELRSRIERRARSAGLLDVGVHYRDFAVAGQWLAPPLGTPSIREQWANASRGTGSVALAVLSGGLNDVLIGARTCFPDEAVDLPECAAVRARLTANIRDLLNDMRDNEVRSVIWLWYPDAPFGAHALLADVFERASALCRELADERFRCEVLDPRPAFTGRPRHFVGASDPSEVGSEALAELVWPRMRALCPAEP